MKITFKIVKDPECGDRHGIEFGDRLSFIIAPLSECPEDAIIGRDLVDGNDLLAVFELGYELGKVESPYEVDRQQVEEL